MSNLFRDFFTEVKPIRFKEPLAETLGAFKGNDVVVDYTFMDTVKMAGHACPTVASAYLCCQKTLEKLYSDGIPVRGEIAVTVYGEPDEGVFGVMGQVFSFLTGAASNTGFKGLGHKFKRKDLLKYSQEKVDSEAMCFRFKKLDDNKFVIAKLFPKRIPVDLEKGKRMGMLLEKVVWESAKREEIEEFQNIWMEKVKSILLDRKEIEKWLILEEGGN